ncbi:unnamed protein product [Leptidea sinapis]|uniref:Uncharacterized protein n=1 Tax=Leptidea sinapis TaxID=189913 RepID=A0A5E4QFL0_9NEOP|nr:unnamed protein product [Leptidea sinapis]
MLQNARGAQVEGAEMQSYEGELNHLGKLEEFLRVKGSRRICEADEIEEIKRQEEIQRGMLDQRELPQ